MHILRIEHQIRDFDTWKGAFDRFSDFRQQSGVRRYQVLRPADDPRHERQERDPDHRADLALTAP